MAPPQLPDEILLDAVKALRDCAGNYVAASAALGIPRATLQGRIRQAQMRGLDGGPAEIIKPPPARTIEPERLRAMLKAPATLEDLATRLGITRGAVIDAIDALKVSGYAVAEDHGRFRLNTAPQSAADVGKLHTYTSRDDGSYVFGFLSDTHLGSKYARLDVVDALFSRFEEIGVDRVFHAGNWIEGEAHDNLHDLTHVGVHQQCSFLASRWPRSRFVTYAVSGNDHEGWYAKREGIDIGRYAEGCFRDIGRTDWIDLGYMEVDIALVHSDTGATARLRNAHPGGGSAYAHSYASQKYMESLSSGEKPAVVLLGHWHKLSCNNIRGSWVIQTGCAQDQTPWARQRRLDYHVGGGICRLVQDPDSGAVLSCTVELVQFFNREFYGTGRWSPHGPVTPAERAIEA